MTLKAHPASGIGALLLIGNVLAWLWALALFGSGGVLIGSAALAYLLGLRHAVDADHIAAIDNVTRKLVQQSKDPVAVGLFFSLGHSTVVVLACIAIATTGLHVEFDMLRRTGAVIGTEISAAFLIVIALANTVALLSAWRSYRARAGGGVFTPRGILSRILQPLTRVIAEPWQMYPLGFLFALGFDTVSSVSVLSMSGAMAVHGESLAVTMVFPALFTAGMTLIDTTDGVLMKRAYGWAMVMPRRKLAYNFAITLFSIMVALVIGGLELLSLVGSHFSLSGWFWRAVEALNEHFGIVGSAIAIALAAIWMGSVLSARLSPASTNTNGQL